MANSELINVNGIGAVRSRVAEVPAPGISLDAHFTPQQVADKWNLSTDKVRELFHGEPGVLVIENANCIGRKRCYRTLRIPASVMERVHRKLSRV